MSELLVLDFDRTLADTDDLFGELCEAADEIEPGLGQKLIEYNEKRLADGDNREMFRPGLVLGDRKAEVFEAFSRIVAEEDKEYIFEDARRLLDKIKKLGKQAVILTFGDPDWQKAKVEAILKAEGYDFPVIYTEEKIKPKVIALFWSEEEQAYKVGPYTASSITSVGDEPSDFEGSEDLPNADWYWINRSGKEQKNKADNVFDIRLLDEIELSE
jgi:FMN phosphatase YigB (HAD superfamily)